MNERVLDWEGAETAQLCKLMELFWEKGEQEEKGGGGCEGGKARYKR